VGVTSNCQLLIENAQSNMGAECPYQAPGVPGAHICQEVPNMGTRKRKLFVPAVKYMKVLLCETKMSAPGEKQSLAAIINMISLNTRKQEILKFNNENVFLALVLQTSPSVKEKHDLKKQKIGRLHTFLVSSFC